MAIKSEFDTLRLYQAMVLDCKVDNCGFVFFQHQVTKVGHGRGDCHHRCRYVRLEGALQRDLRAVLHFGRGDGPGVADILTGQERFQCRLATNGHVVGASEWLVLFFSHCHRVIASVQTGKHGHAAGVRLHASHHRAGERVRHVHRRPGHFRRALGVVSVLVCSSDTQVTFRFGNRSEGKISSG